MRWFARFSPRIACFVAAMLMSGCGSAGPARLALTGKVTYQGQPVPYGEISFEPDAQAGNTGVQGTGEIKDGVFQTNPGFGPCTGQQIVHILAYDGRSAGDPRLPHGDVLGPEQIIKINLEPGTKTWDFALALDAKKPDAGATPPAEPSVKPPPEKPEPVHVAPRPTPAPAPLVSRPIPPIHFAADYPAIENLVLLCRTAAGVVLIGVLIGGINLMLNIGGSRAKLKIPAPSNGTAPAAVSHDARPIMWMKLTTLAVLTVCVLGLLATAEILLLAARVEHNTRHVGR